MKLTDCYLCGSESADILFTFKGEDKLLATVFETPPNQDMNWMICNSCSLVYRSPVLDVDEYEKLYENYDTYIFANTTPDEYFDKIVSLPIGKSENREKARWLKQALSQHKTHNVKRILDIGCGGGTLLHILRDELSPQTVNGVELNPIYADLAKRRLEADIRNESYSSGLFGDKFDLLINTKVLEHILNPLPFLKEMFEDLEVSGLLFIEVPDVSDMFNFPLNDERFAIAHVYFFSKNTLTALLQKAGFKVINARVFSSSRNRSYLQILAEKNTNTFDENELKKPYDDVLSIVKKIKQNMNKEEAVKDSDEG